MNQQQRTLVIALAAITLIITTSIVTVGTNHYFDRTGKTKDRSGAAGFGPSMTQPKFGVFAGFEACKKAIYDSLPGRVIAIQSDDRAAKADNFHQQNTLYFEVNLAPNDKKYLSEQHSTVKYSVKCVTSSETNKVLRVVPQLIE